MLQKEETLTVIYGFGKEFSKIQQHIPMVTILDLKKSISLYPFIPMANILLGKIFLIRGSATRDYTLINNARLMFEMARALEPDSAESETLLELLGARPME